MENKKLNFMDRMDEWFAKHLFIACITIGAIILTLIGLGVILPIALAISFKNWWPLFIFLPEIGMVCGAIFYLGEF